MERKEILIGLNEALEDMMDDSVEENTFIEDLKKWSKLSTDGLAEVLEDQFNVVIDTDDIDDMEKVEELIDVLEQEL